MVSTLLKHTSGGTGGNQGGSGALVSGEFTLSIGDVLNWKCWSVKRLETYSTHIAGGGGGGTFVTPNGNPLLVAGGGGGSGSDEVGDSGLHRRQDIQDPLEMVVMTGQGCGGAGFSGNGSGSDHGGTTGFFSQQWRNWSNRFI